MRVSGFTMQQQQQQQWPQRGKSNGKQRYINNVKHVQAISCHTSDCMHRYKKYCRIRVLMTIQ
jgi:hypothetical protein